MTGWNNIHEWRCISYIKNADFPASHLSFQGFISKEPTSAVLVKLCGSHLFTRHAWSSSDQWQPRGSMLQMLDRLIGKMFGVKEPVGKIGNALPVKQAYPMSSSPLYFVTHLVYLYGIYTVMSLTVYLFHNPYLGNRVVFHFPANSVGIELCVCKTGFWLGCIVQVSTSFDPFVLSVGYVWLTNFVYHVYQVYLINSNKNVPKWISSNFKFGSMILTPAIADHEIEVWKTPGYSTEYRNLQKSQAYATKAESEFEK